MSQPFLGEIKIISWNFAPRGWAFCNGQFLPINQNQALFSILGTTYGGNGQTTFALPDFRGRAAMHVGGGFIQGQAGGQESHTAHTSGDAGPQPFRECQQHGGPVQRDEPTGNYPGEQPGGAVPHARPTPRSRRSASPTSAARSRTRTASRFSC